MTESDPDAEARRTLRRHRAFATALLILMAALILETPPDVQPGAKPPGRLEGAIAFSGVAFSCALDAPSRGWPRSDGI